MKTWCHVGLNHNGIGLGCASRENHVQICQMHSNILFGERKHCLLDLCSLKPVPWWSGKESLKPLFFWHIPHHNHEQTWKCSDSPVNTWGFPQMGAYTYSWMVYKEKSIESAASGTLISRNLNDSARIWRLYAPTGWHLTWKFLCRSRRGPFEARWKCKWNGFVFRIIPSWGLSRFISMKLGWSPLSLFLANSEEERKVTKTMN